MPTYHKHHIIDDHRKTIELAIDELIHLKDTGFIVIRAHQIIDSVLFTWISKHVPNVEPLQDAELKFKQLTKLARAFMETDTQPWIWKFIHKLSHLRNESVHELYPKNRWNLERLVEFARPFLHLEPEPNLLIGLQKTLVMVILVLQSLLSPAAELGKRNQSQTQARKKRDRTAWRLIAMPS